MLRRIIIGATAVAAATIAIGAAIAQGYPDKPITLIVAFPPFGDASLDCAAIMRIHGDQSC